MARGKEKENKTAGFMEKLLDGVEVEWMSFREGDNSKAESA